MHLKYKYQYRDIACELSIVNIEDSSIHLCNCIAYLILNESVPIGITGSSDS